MPRHKVQTSNIVISEHWQAGTENHDALSTRNEAVERDKKRTISQLFRIINL
ncbi:MAG: hypothetical protein KUG81_07785 [Gammaproteobacteria bacterium]|nr:hypothetical protein [Gammaproteobacteria bacterium]